MLEVSRLDIENCASFMVRKKQAMAIPVEILRKKHETTLQHFKRWTRGRAVTAISLNLNFRENKSRQTFMNETCLAGDSEIHIRVAPRRILKRLTNLITNAVFHTRLKIVWILWWIEGVSESCVPYPWVMARFIMSFRRICSVWFSFLGLFFTRCLSRSFSVCISLKQYVRRSRALPYKENIAKAQAAQWQVNA